MKRLAILSSLALLISPCFNAANGSGLNHGRVFNAAAEGGETSYKEEVGTITFGEATDSNYDSSALSKLDSVCKTSGYFPGTPSFSNISRCFTFKDSKSWTGDSTVDPALKMGATSKNATASCFTVNFGGDAIIKQVALYAKYWDSNANYSVSSSNGKSSDSNTLNGNDFEKYLITSLGSDDNTSSSWAKISLTAKKRAYLSKVEFTFSVPVKSTAKTVTYDYGEVNYKNIKGFDLTESEEVESGKTITNPLTEECSYDDWTGLYEFQGWYTDVEKKNPFITGTEITENITLHALWEVLEIDEITNLKQSGTKAQLNYKYGYVPTTVEAMGTLNFGEGKSDGSEIDDTTSSDFYSFSGVDGISVEGFSDYNKCYSKLKDSDGTTYALKFGSSNSSGKITFSFNSAITIKNIKLYASRYKASEEVSCQLTANGKTESKGVAITTDGFLPYEFSDLSGIELTSLTIGASSGKRFYVSKIEILTEIDSGESKLEVSNIGMRFGAFLKTEDYEAIGTAGGAITGYGVVCATSLPDGYSSVAYATRNKVLGSDSYIWTNNVEEKPLTYTETIEGVEYYVFNTYIDVAATSLDKTVYAAGFVVLDTGVTVYFAEKSASVKSLAQEYIDSKVSYDDVITETLGYLAQGKVSA